MAQRESNVVDGGTEIRAGNCNQRLLLESNGRTDECRLDHRVSGAVANQHVRDAKGPGIHHATHRYAESLVAGATEILHRCEHARLKNPQRHE
jgi:hypothetical protein